ncbi:MAG: hypothetical protein A2X84_04495 [Desulfuromonadaceae bacterium GWC2_58_13]|nr:MAG: hypothetical protein A2X84_04495 [Desulfuromonadaceae bacterium GWC2_58_13]
MPRSAGMNLVFRLGTSAFSLSVDDLAEIRQEPASQLTDDENRSFPYCLGTLAYRDQKIPVINLKALFRIPTGSGGGDLLNLLILVGESGFWGVPVSRIEGIFPLSAFSVCRAPFLAMLTGPRPYQTLELWRDELLIRCDALWLEQFWCRA